MEPPPLKPIDSRGRRVRVGDRVRIVGVPDLSTMSKENRAECEPVFLHLRGTCKSVGGFDRYGHAEIFFTIRKGPHRGIHSVAIEPYLLLVQHARHGA